MQRALRLMNYVLIYIRIQRMEYQYVYGVVTGVEVPDVALPQATTKLSEEDVKKVQDALSLAKMLEDKKLWRRAATVYTSTLGMATTANELWLLAKMRNRCLRNATRC